MQTAMGSIWNELHWCKHRLEPSISEVTSDPIIRAVMRRDGVTMAELRQVIEAARRRAVSAVSNRGGANGAGYRSIVLQVCDDDKTSRRQPE